MNKKQEYLKELSKFSEKQLERLVELSKSEKITQYLENSLMFIALKAKLKAEGLL